MCGLQNEKWKMNSIMNVATQKWQNNSIHKSPTSGKCCCSLSYSSHHFLLSLKSRIQPSRRRTRFLFTLHTTTWRNHRYFTKKNLQNVLFETEFLPLSTLQTSLKYGFWFSLESIPFALKYWCKSSMGCWNKAQIGNETGLSWWIMHLHM